MVLTVFFFFANIRKLSVILGKCFWQWCCIYLCWTSSWSKLNPIVQRTRKENATVYLGWCSAYGVNKLIKSVSLILDTGIINHYNYKYVCMYILSPFTLASANNSILINSWILIWSSHQSCDFSFLSCICSISVYEENFNSEISVGIPPIDQSN